MFVIRYTCNKIKAVYPSGDVSGNYIVVRDLWGHDVLLPETTLSTVQPINKIQASQW